MAVQKIVSGVSGKAPFLVFGPPGTGKTITVVEAILQLVTRDSKCKILVCTDSNMAADYIAMRLVQYHEQVKTAINQSNKNIDSKMQISDHFLLRANSKVRLWQTLPMELYMYSNGTSKASFYSDSSVIYKYKIVVSTLNHAACFENYQVTHLIIDEAAQASEPSSLIPITRCLKPDGLLVLAGDPKQLGPVCLSSEAAKLGLGRSLMERLAVPADGAGDGRNYQNLYGPNGPYISMLVRNFRSHHDILLIPNQRFYDNRLQACCEADPLSNVCILGIKEKCRAISFHGLQSKEGKQGKSPSFFNEYEAQKVIDYVTALIRNHHVRGVDIGVVTPYARQMFKVKKALAKVGFEDVEVGTTEAFQGKEKRVIIITTVRANNRPLDPEGQYKLGFISDDKRFNVALTRAKAKLIVIGCPVNLENDEKWSSYMELCKQFDSYYGYVSQRRQDVDHENLMQLMRELAIMSSIEEEEEEP